MIYKVTLIVYEEVEMKQNVGSSVRYTFYDD